MSYVRKQREVVTEENARQQKSYGAFGLVAMFVLLAAVAGGAGVGYFQLQTANQHLAQELQQLKSQAGSEQQGVSAMQQTIADLQKTWRITASSRPNRKSGR